MSARSLNRLLPLFVLPLACAPSNAFIPDDPEDATTSSASTGEPASSTGTTGAPTSSTGDESTGEPEPESALLVHSFGDYTMTPHLETEPCVQWTLHNDEPLYINRVILSNDGGFHHSNWLVVPEDTFPGEDGYYNCWERGFNELQAAVAGTVLFAQSTQSRYEEQDLPDGVVIKVPPRHKVVAGVHLLNLSSAEVASELRMGLEIVHPKTVETIVAPFRLNYQQLMIPALSESRFTGECILDEDYEARAGVPFDLKLYHVLPHYHYLGNYFSVEIVGGPRDGEQIYMHTGFNADGNGRTYDPPIDLTGARGLRFTCGYDNWLAKQIGYGIGDQEMCVMLGLADMRVMMSASVDAGTKLVGTDDDILLHEGSCGAVAIPKSAAQSMPGADELEGPLYVPPGDPDDVDLDPVKPCIDTPADAAPLAPATLTSLRETLFAPSCNFSSCHGGKTPVAVRLDGSDLHAQLLGPGTTQKAMPLVTPGDPDKSWLYQLVSRCEPTDTSGHVHTHMPFNAPNLLEPRLVAKLRAWILAGAPAG